MTPDYDNDDDNDDDNDGDFAAAGCTAPPWRFLKWKGKSSEFNPKDYEQVKSSPSLKVWSHDGSNLHPKMTQ